MNAAANAMDRGFHAMMRTVMPLLASLAVILAAGCAETAGPPDPASAEETVSATATVEKLDLASRTVELKTEDGRMLTIVAGPEIRNFDQLNIGDTVKATYMRGVAARMAEPGRTGEAAVVGAAVRAPKGAKPGAVVGQTVQMVVTIVSYDAKSHLATFAGPDGLVRSVVVEKPEMQQFARGLKPGDEVEVTFTEAVAIGIVETGGN